MPSEPVDPFDDVNVSAFAIDSSEQLGTKPKQWLRSPDDRRWLYKWVPEKQALRGRGEDWAEKVVGEIGVLLGVPCAVIELAHRGTTRGIISLDVVVDDLDLVHGNELLAGRVPSYPRAELRNLAEYRVDTVVSVLEEAEPAPWTGRPATEDFAGYLVLDALVANTDRHHENWAVLVPQRGSRTPVLAPTFDHASSLACGLTDEERGGPGYKPRTRASLSQPLSAVPGATSQTRPRLSMPSCGCTKSPLTPCPRGESG